MTSIAARLMRLVPHIWNHAARSFGVVPPSTLLNNSWMQQQIIDNSPYGMMLVDVLQPDFPIMYVNTAFEQLTGYCAADLLGKNASSLQNDDRDQERCAEMRQALERAQSCTVVLRNYRKDGSMFWNEVHLAPIRDKSGHATHYIITLKDVTEKIHAEIRYRTLFEQSNDAIFILDLTGKHQYVNQRAADLFGYSKEELVGMTYHELVVPEQQQDSADVLHRLIAGEQQPVYERTFRRKDGRLLFTEINIQVVRDQEGNPLHFQSVIRDDTERQQTEENPAQERDLLQTMIDNMPDSIYVTDMEGHYLLSNLSFLQLRGLKTQEELFGKTVFDFLEPEVAEKFFAEDQMVMRTGQGFINREVYLTARPQDPWRSLTKVPWRDERGEIIGIVVISRRITEHKRAQQQEFELRLEKERIQLLKRFIQHAAHEFRTPLSLLSIGIYLLSRSNDPDWRALKTEQLGSEINRINNLLDQLLLMVKLESSESFSLSPVNLSEILRSECQRLAMKYKNQPRLQVELPPEVLFVTGDGNYLRHALGQLLDNAYRFTSGDGSITVTAGSIETEIWVEIRDTGIGIAKGDLTHIWKTFWRNDEAHTTPGFGLGLPIARRIIERHRGKLSVESEVQRGSCFRVTLPINLETQVDGTRTAP